MGDNSCDIEFFDYENVCEEEIKEIQAILKGPGSNSSVELPWVTSFKENSTETALGDDSIVSKVDSLAIKNTKPLEMSVVADPALQFASQHAAMSAPVAHLPPPAVEAYVAPPTTVGPYPNPSYFVSRTIPYLRAYPHMGVPFFACPIPPGATGENSPLPSPYGQFVPVVPATMAQEKFVGPTDSDSNQKNRPNDRQFNRRSKKKSSSDFSSGSFESETIVDVYRESTDSEEQTSVPSVSTTISSDRPTTVPIVPLPVQPTSFGVPGAALSLHSYPPGLHTLPYTQMSGPQAPAAPMYYVPVFNHPYGSYIPSPPSPMVLPVSLHPETESSSSPVNNSHTANVLTSIETAVLPVSLPTSSESDPHVQSNNEQTSLKQFEELDDGKPLSTDSAAKNVSEGEDLTDCNSSSDYPMSKSISSSPDCIPDTAEDCYDACLPANEEVKQASLDTSRCWADLFKKPCSAVNGIDRHPSQQRHKTNTLKKNIVNGKVHVPHSDVL